MQSSREKNWQFATVFSSAWQPHTVGSGNFFPISLQRGIFDPMPLLEYLSFIGSVLSAS
jgi:hypothetical protein